MEEQHFPSRSDRHKQEHNHEKIKKEKPKKADKSGIFFKRETEDLELTIGRDKTGRTLDDAWYMKADVKTLFSLKKPKVSKVIGSLFLWGGAFLLMLVLSNPLSKLTILFIFLFCIVFNMIKSE